VSAGEAGRPLLPRFLPARACEVHNETLRWAGRFCGPIHYRRPPGVRATAGAAPLIRATQLATACKTKPCTDPCERPADAAGGWRDLLTNFPRDAPPAIAGGEVRAFEHRQSGTPAVPARRPGLVFLFCSLLYQTRAIITKGTLCLNSLPRGFFTTFAPPRRSRVTSPYPSPGRWVGRAAPRPSCAGPAPLSGTSARRPSCTWRRRSSGRPG
jgi:hypothetical protein